MKKTFKITLCIVAVLLLFNNIMGQFALPVNINNSVSGYVFNDINKNKKFDTYEHGIPGILVSNCIDIVETDNEGKYSINTCEGNNIIFIIKPPGWKLPCNKNYIPQFFKSFQISAEDSEIFPGGKSVVSVSESLDFPLYKDELQNEFEFIAFADPQSRKAIEIYYVRDDVVSELISNNAEFAITLGDILYDDLSLFELHNEIMGKMGIPVYNIPGNHDMDYDAPDDREALKTYKSIYGPSYYAFEYGKTSFIMLDNVEWMGSESGGNKGNYRGKVGDTQLEWIRNYLKFVPADHLIVLAMHIPLYYSGSPDPAVNVVDREDLFEVLSSFENIVFVAGHMHMIEHSFIGEEMGWKGENDLHHITCSAVSGSWWTGPRNERGIPEANQRDGSPNGYHVFNINGNRYQEYFKAAGEDKEFQIRVSSPYGKIMSQGIDTVQIIANIFNASERSKVECIIDDNEAFEMTNTIIPDPFIIREYNLPGSGYPESLRALPTTHIWIADLPPDLSPGSHKITVKTMDIYGNEYSASSVFEIE